MYGPTTPGFLTGSRAYGTPKPGSDTDVVVYMERKEADHLLALHPACTIKTGGYGEPGADSFSFRFGDLNLIVVTSLPLYDAWREGTEDLVEAAPVTRDFAVKILSQKRALFCDMGAA